MNRLITFIARPFYLRYEKLIWRITSLETVVNILIEDEKYYSSQDIGFNGQIIRKKIFHDLIDTFGCEIIIETGTWIGNTTGYMSETTSLPVMTCELQNTYMAIAKKRLKAFNNISFKLSDSRRYLKELGESFYINNKAFIYLDAHWHADLPLREEIRIICNNWRSNFVILIDDFEVPGDDGYGFDDYGKGKSLTLKTFSKLFAELNLVPFFPKFSSSEETGEKRGCVVLIKENDVDKLSGSTLLVNGHEKMYQK